MAPTVCFLPQGQGGQAGAVEGPRRSPRTAHRRNVDTRRFPGSARAGGQWASRHGMQQHPRGEIPPSPRQGCASPSPIPGKLCPPRLVNSAGALASPPRVPAHGQPGTLLTQGPGSMLCCWHAGTSLTRHAARPRVHPAGGIAPLPPFPTVPPGQRPAGSPQRRVPAPSHHSRLQTPARTPPPPLQPGEVPQLVSPVHCVSSCLLCAARS